MPRLSGGRVRQHCFVYQNNSRSRTKGAHSAFLVTLISIQFGLKCADENLADSIRNLASTTLTPELWDGIIRLWKDDAITKAWARSAEYQLIDSARYWFDNVERISKAGDTYVPTVDDILHARQMTTGIVEITWVLQKREFKMIDVGGQRNHRAKWIHAFEGITAVIFCVALSEYDQKLREDESKNRMHESLELFDQIINSEWFYKTPIMVFFNKKVRTYPSGVVFCATRVDESHGHRTSSRRRFRRSL